MSLVRPILVALCGLVVLTACAAGPKFAAEQAPGKNDALVYLYRPWLFLHGAGSPTVKINNDRVVELYNGGYAAIRAAPGQIRLYIDEYGAFSGQSSWNGEVRINAKANETYYVRWAPNFVRSYSGGYPYPVTTVVSEGLFEIVSEDQGRAEILKTNRLEVTKRENN